MSAESETITIETIAGWSNQEILELVKLGFFDSDFYLIQNPDIAAARIDPLLHFLEHGWREGRRPVEIISQTEMDFIMNLVATIKNPLNIFKLNHPLMSDPFATSG